MATLLLLVDDEPEDADRARDILSPHGFDVEIVTTSMAAVITIERRHPEIIVLDIAIGEGRGMELLDHVKANPALAAVPVVVVTQRASHEDILACYKFGADYFLAKPYSPRQLLHAVGLPLGRNLLA
jgi:DNA-binding response OmpR family regulator